MKNLSSKFAAFAIGAAGVFASFNPAFAQAIKWNVVSEKSSINYATTWTDKQITGSFNNFNANINFNPNDLKSSNVVVVINTSPIQSPSREANDNLPLKDWLNTKAFPNAKFESNSFRKTGADTYVADGFLTIKGVKYRLALPFNVQIANNQAIMTSRVNLDRINLKIGLESDAKAEWVSRNVAINIKVVATK